MNDMRFFDELASLAHDLGSERLIALMSAKNRAQVIGFCDHLVCEKIPLHATIGGYAYELVNFLKPKEKVVSGNTMFCRAEELSADLGQAQVQHILMHQGDIPIEWRAYTIVFTSWISEGRYVNCIVWDGEKWDRRWSSVQEDGGEMDRFLRSV